jgi:hypothetical protein
MDTFEDVMLDLAWRRFSEEWDIKKTIETKASILLTANGIILGLIVSGFQYLQPWFVNLSILLITCSAVLCVLSLKVRKYVFLGINESWEAFEETREDIEQTKLDIFATLGDSELKNRETNRSAAKTLSLAIWVFLIALILIAFAIIF